MKTTKSSATQSRIVAQWVRVSLLMIVLACIAGFLLPPLTYGAEGNLQWAKRPAGGTGRGRGIAIDGSGNSYVTGAFDGTVTFGLGEANQTILTAPGGSNIFFVAKYDTSGLLQWAKRAGGTGSGEVGDGIAVDGSGNSYITGEFFGTAIFGLGEANQTILTSADVFSDIFVAKYDTSGLLQWAKRAGGGSTDQGYGIAVDGSGNSYITGYFFDTATFGLGEANQTILTSAGSRDIIVAKYDTSGLLQWAKRAGGTGNGEVGDGIAVDGSGNSYVTGAFDGTATFGLGEANQTILTSAGSTDIFVAKYDTSGLLQWAKRAGGTGSGEGGDGIAVDGSGNSYVTGVFDGTATFGLGEANQTILTSAGGFDIFVAKYDTSALLQWAKRAGGTASFNREVGDGIAVDGSGNSYVTGDFYGTATFGLGEANQTILTSAGGIDVFVAKYDTSGLLQWAKRAGGGSTDHGYGIAVDGSANSYVTGSFTGTVSFGSGEWTLPGGNPIFVAKFLGSSAPFVNISPVDFDGDGGTDPAVYEVSGNNWFFAGTSWGFAYHLGFGGPSYLPVPGDYDGDGVADIAVYETSSGDWFYIGSTVGLQSHTNFGGPGYVPVPGDYDGDGVTDFAVYDAVAGHWFINETTAGHKIHPSFGGPGYVPVPGDYDGDGKSDIAVYQMGSGAWCYVGSTSGIVCQAAFGGPGYVPVPGDYDGDGKSDIAVYQTSSGNWFWVGSTLGFDSHLGFGGSGFVPVPGDYDGDGAVDTAVYQESTGNWVVVGTTSGYFTPALNFGGAGFVPVLPQMTILRAMGLL